MQKNEKRRDITLMSPNCFTASLASLTIKKCRNMQTFRIPNM